MAGDWLGKAVTDVQVCESLMALGSAFGDVVAFHAQQAGEKALKAWLVWHQIEFPKTHDVERLLELVATGDRALAESLADAAELTPYGVEYRYPGEYPPVSETAAAAAAALAHRVVDEVARRLSPL